ncbi:FecR domain-containing protein [Aliifodinibius sp. S!AR15-10]|uniref:FecR family protein n=1 Tax=Aliifodinibius sp. S!AR15-10 TaxID=2950437 RepID=UPI002863FAAF|nr:FecR domain-containing protein [Aliifodinibius sp. S!AR15-10]MDR8390887.1 FecR domain-containing protein [Aliifodinibius sp. S!AR15-10]
MADKFNIPEDDRDLILAREIGQRLDTGSSLSDISDPLMQPLLKFREEREKRSSRLKTDSTGLWNSIEQQISPDEQSTPNYRLYNLRNYRVWAAAAAILLIVTTGLFYLLNQPTATLITETQGFTQTINLADGSTVTLRPYSKIHLVTESPEKLEYDLTGEAFFDVVSNPDRTFSVKAGNGRVNVLGTSFMLSSWGDLVQVYLQEGSVQFETVDRSASTTLEPGEYASISGSRLTEPETANEELFTDWINNELAFQDQPAQYVFSELEQHFNISITASRNIAETRIGGRLSLENLEASLNDLGLVLGGTFISTGEKQYRFEAE